MRNLLPLGTVGSVSIELEVCGDDDCFVRFLYPGSAVPCLRLRLYELVAVNGMAVAANRDRLRRERTEK
jgi:hypothetical protein